MRWLDELRQDLQFGTRALFRAPAWAATTIATLALGIALTTAIFSLVYGVLIRQLPYTEPERIVAIWSSAPAFPRFNVTYQYWEDWRAHARSFEDVALIRPVANFNLTGSGEPERLQGARTTWNVPSVLGVRPLLGRVFTEEETGRDARVVVLSYALWQMRFAGSPDVIGRKIELNGGPFEVIGVMPSHYRFPSRDFQLWSPLYVPPTAVRGANDFSAIARLKPGTTAEQAQAETTAMIQRAAPVAPSAAGRIATRVEPLLDSNVRNVRASLQVLMAAAGSLLLVGSLNLALLLIGRGIARQRELAVRAALGANRSRLVRQMLAESLPLACAGALGGLVLANWMLSLLLRQLPTSMPNVDSIGLHGPVVVFAIVSSFAVVLGAALWSARRSAGVRFNAGLQQMSRGVTRRGGAQGRLVVTQVAVTMVILFTGALFARTAVALLRTDLGFAPQAVLTMHLAVTRAQYPEDSQIAAYYRRLEERIKSLPGVVAAGFVNRLPLSGIGQSNPIVFEDRPDLGPVQVDTRSATPGYFPAMGIPLRAGRLLSDGDREGGSLVGLIDDALARRVFGTADPVGRRMRFSIGSMQAPWVEIVGVVGHIRHESPQVDPFSQVYFPETQRAQDRAALVVKASGDASALTAGVITAIRQENPDQPVYDVRTLEDWRDRVLQTQQLLTGLVALFGGATLLLASVGLYGVVSHATALRMREFAIRVALGAKTSDVRRLVLGHAGRLVLTGVAFGLALAFPAGMSVQSLLYGVRATDGVALIVPGVLLIGVCLMAAAGPARRAMKLDPALALRTE